MLALLTTAMWAMVNDGMLVLLALVLAFQGFRKRGSDTTPDWNIVLEFAGLIVALSLLCLDPAARESLTRGAWGLSDSASASRNLSWSDPKCR